MQESINYFYNLEYLIIDNGAQCTNLLWCNPNITLIFINGPHRCKYNYYNSRIFTDIKNINIITKKCDKPHDHNWEFDEDMKEELKKCLHNNFSLLLKI